MQNIPQNLSKKRVISGIQTSGEVHLGNYLGAIKNWVKMQEEYDCVYFLADLHAITIPQNPVHFKEAAMKQAACLMASGINPSKSLLFLQSSCPAHAELAWILMCNVPMGWLKRMTQFKDKAGKNQDNVSCGLFTYPVLMAADILLYNADLVPVGEDQKQHLELARDIAELVNRMSNEQLLKVPEPLINSETARVKSLRDGMKKMSKSDPSDQSRINLSDSPEVIMDKIKKAKTDSLDYFSYEESRPELANLLEIFASFSGQSMDSILGAYQGSGFGKFKADLGEMIVSNLSPIREEYQRLLSDPAHIEDTLRASSLKANAYANETLTKVKKAFGFMSL